jgi:sec-independent protein translocase protein TatA
MFDELFRGWTPIIILAVGVLLGGATRLPALARSLGQSRNAFKAEMKKGQAESTEAAPTDTTVTTTDESTNTTPKP